MDQAADLAWPVPEIFYLLARRFWPGPLTIIVKADPKLPLKVTANTGNVALRVPAAEILDELLARLDQPLIATSANISGHPTCTSGIQVFVVLDGRVDLVLDGGPSTSIGPTTLDITEQHWRIIREGAIAGSDIAECLDSAS